jgi:hypothetical protein
MIHPIGHFANPPIPKLGKLHGVFEHLFNLMRWFFYAHALVTLLFILFTYHDAFELRSLEGVFIIFAGPCLVDNFRRTSLAWDSLGHEFHKVDTMAYTPDDNDNRWRLERNHGISHLAPTIPMFFLWRSKHHFGGIDVTLGLGFLWRWF